MVTVTADRTKLVVESAEAVLGLHWFVARDYTAKDEGLEFEIITPGIKTKFELADPRRRDHHLCHDRTGQQDRRRSVPPRLALRDAGDA